MNPFYCRVIAKQYYLMLLSLLGIVGTVQAQAPIWNLAATTITAQDKGVTVARAMTTDANGNVFVTGYFIGQVYFGSTLLTSSGNLGNGDLFVAKYVPASGTWAWAQSGGGTSGDVGRGIVVSGANIYVTGTFSNDMANTKNVLFGGTGTIPGTVQVNGTASILSNDMILLKYTDNGTSATLGWTQVGGGRGDDESNGVAVSGSSVYITGQLNNDAANTNGVLFGGAGTTPGMAQVNGTASGTGFDILLAKYTDNGTSATLGWTRVGGGPRSSGYGVAASGPNVYVTGRFYNNTANTVGVVFGGMGTTPGTTQVNGATSTASDDAILLKYTDNGPNAMLRWTQVGGGTRDEGSYGVAVSGSSVYVVGSIYNTVSNAYGVIFGGAGTTPGMMRVNGATSTASYDVVVAKYTDSGSSATLGWVQTGGGTGDDTSGGVAVGGSNVYVTGAIFNNTANANGVVFGGTGTTPGTTQVNGVTGTASSDLVLAKYVDNGPGATLSWAQVGGGAYYDYGYGVAVSGTSVLVGSNATPTAYFGSIAVVSPFSDPIPVLARLTDTALTPLSTLTANATVGLALYPSPASGPVHLANGVPGASIQVLSVLGHVVGTATADASGAASLPGGLAPGLYLVRCGTQVARLVVE